VKPFPGLIEREKLRSQRIVNYAVKFRDGYRCQYPECKKNFELLVVRTKKGETADAFTTRCQRHLKTGTIEIAPGQWNER
jgi:hypothetical protein